MIAQTEYRQRQARIVALARERGYNGVLCWARGGSTQDRFADLFYFSGYYPLQPFVPDRPGRWRAQGHAALLVCGQGPAILVSDAIEFQEQAPAADRFESDADVIGKVARLVDKEVQPGSVALVGSDTLAFAWERALRKA